MDRPEVGIIIPAYNEAATIGTVISNVKKYGIVIVVNDCSTDLTSSIAEENGAVVVNHTQNAGYDGALSSGFKKANELCLKYVITFDADGQHDEKLIEKYLHELIHNEKKLVLGIRPEKARISETVMGIYFSGRFGIHDILCGMKGYHMDLYKEHGAFDTIGSIGSELTLASIKRGYEFTEIPVPIHDRQDQPRFGSLLKANYKIFKALFKVLMMDIHTAKAKGANCG